MKDILCSWSGRLNIVNTVILPSDLQNQHTTYQKSQLSFCKTYKLTLKFTKLL